MAPEVLLHSAALLSSSSALGPSADGIADCPMLRGFPFRQTFTAFVLLRRMHRLPFDNLECHGMLETLMRHPDEIPPLVNLKITQQAIPNDPNLAFCYRMLTRVSRSFSIATQQLPPELRDAVQLNGIVVSWI